jgi:hypothetical protein
MDEDPKCIKVIKIPSLDSKGVPVHYDRLAVSPDNQLLAVTHGSTLQWLRSETGEVLDTAENAHDGACRLLAIILLVYTLYLGRHVSSPNILSPVTCKPMCMV